MKEKHNAPPPTVTDEPPAEPGPEDILLTPMAAPVIGLAPQSLRARRVRGNSPPYIRISANRVGYRYADLIAWRNAHTFSSTAQEHAAGPKSAA